MTRARDLAAFVSNADGDIKFDTDTLFIDSSANRVGIGLTNPTGSLHISNSAPSFYMTDTTNNTEGVVSMDNAGSLILNADLNNEASSSNIRFAVDGSEAMRIDDSGNVGVLNTTPNSYTAGAKNLVVGATGATGITIASSNNTNGSLFFADGTTGNEGYRGYLQYNHTDDMFSIGAAATQKLRVDSDGLKFNSDTAAANALDDYEEGTWSTTANTANVTSITYAKQTYTKIGRKVFIQVKITATVTAANTRTYFSFVMPFSTPNNDDMFTGGGMSEANSSPFSDIAMAAGDSSQSSANTMYWAFIPVQTGGHTFYLHGQFETS